MAKKRRSKYNAATSDRHVLYQMSVQNVESEIDFVDDTYKELRGKHAVKLREDFAGTCNTSCEWVRRRTTNTAIGVDLDKPTLDWGAENNIANLTPAQQKRVKQANTNVLDPGPGTSKMDVILAMNFSYWIFQERAQLRDYFKSIRESLAPGGLFFLDFYGGYDSMREQTEAREIDGLFDYVWDQDSYDPISGAMTCYIHFHFNDGSKMRRAFSYHWRLWTLAEIRELLEEAGFARSTVYWEGEDDEGEGDGEFKAVEKGVADAAFISYIVAEP